LRARFLLLRLLYQLHNALQQGVGRGSAYLNLQRAVAVHCAREHGVAYAFVNGHALACDGRLINMRFAVQHDAIGRDALARAGQHAVADL
jgi:hypothetical protein